MSARHAAGDGALARLRRWRARGRHHGPEGRRLFHVVDGAGPDLLLLHAVPTASWGWHRMWPALTARFRCWAVDLLGSGFSDKPPEGPYDVASLTDAVEGLCAARGVARPHVLAHGYGSCVALELLARAGSEEERVRPASLAVVNGAVFPEVARENGVQRLLCSPLGPLLARCAPNPRRAFHRHLAAALRPGTCDEHDLEAFWRQFAHADGHRRIAAVSTYLRERRRLADRWRGALERTTVPLCYAAGAGDRLTGAPTLERWRALLPHAACIELDPSLGHYPPLEDPHGLMAAWTDFVDTAPAAA